MKGAAVFNQQQAFGHLSMLMNSPAKRLAGKVTIVTGGARGIGAAIATLFSQHGAHVIVADLLEDLGSSLAETIGGRFIRCDVSMESDVEAAVKLAFRWKGRLDVMVNNAGIAGPDGSITSLEMCQLKATLDVNLNGVVHGIKYAARAMVEAGRGGSIICTASSAALMGGLGSHSYTLSKEAIIGVARSCACELGVHGIRVNCVSPHGVPTDILVNAFRELPGREEITAEEVGKVIAERGSLLKGRCGSVADAAAAALFLASDESGFVTGHNLVVDGGFTSGVNTMSYIYHDKTQGD
uniref:Uncharacterized protein n=1 Tax=Kalanchoe fedtschenkoi TaxID=63787 RepID=A0A7N0ZUG3_KALFE